MEEGHPSTKSSKCLSSREESISSLMTRTLKMSSLILYCTTRMFSKIFRRRSRKKSEEDNVKRKRRRCNRKDNGSKKFKIRSWLTLSVRGRRKKLEERWRTSTSTSTERLNHTINSIRIKTSLTINT
jgi:hypothetical protein